MTTADIPANPHSDVLSALLARNWWAVALRAVAAILFGLISLLAPGATMLSLVLLFAALILVDGVMNLISGLRSARRHERWRADPPRRRFVSSGPELARPTRGMEANGRD